MSEIEKEILDVVRKINMLSELTVSLNKMNNEIDNILVRNTNISVLPFPRGIEEVVFEISKIPTLKLKNLRVECLDGKSEGYFYGKHIWIQHGNKSINFWPALINDVLELYAVEKCNPGFLDYLIEKTRERVKEVAETLEMLKKIVAMIETLMR